MKKNVYSLLFLMVAVAAMFWPSATKAQSQGWPAQYGGVMLQGFYWDSYDDTQWTLIEGQADELAGTFDLIWIPQSANCGGTSMGYDDLYWFPGHYNSSFGTEAELRQMIKTLKDKGIGTIADVVINHRKNVSNWVDFPRETYNGVTYELKSTDIVGDDDGGDTKTWATKNGYTLGNPEGTSEAYGGSCEGWGGMRDLDHSSANVQTNVKAYLHMLLEDLGYTGFRYDMVKGYPAKYTGLYNSDAKVQFSVGEFWDGNATYVRKWIDATKVDGQVQSAAFDFPFRYTVRDAVNNGTWSKLANTSLITTAAYRRYSVTFIENHDTEWRSNGEKQDPLLKDTLAGNAWLLAMPGTPCVFLKHYQAYPADIRSMVAVRKAAGIHNESVHKAEASNAKYYAASVDGKLLVAVGNEAQVTPDATKWTRVLAGYHYAYYLANTLETPWASLASGSYKGEQQVLLTAVTAAADAQLVYTTDGSAPTAQSTKVKSGTTIAIPVGTTVLRVGLLVGNTVKTTITRNYTIQSDEEEPFAIPSFCTVGEDEVCAFFEAPTTWSNTVCCWAWVDSPADNFTYAERANWPGASCTLLGKADNGKKVWKWTWDGKKQNNTAAPQPEKIIFSNSGSPQTKDMIFENGGYYTFDDSGTLAATVVPSGITPVKADLRAGNGAIYTLGGQRVKEATRPGVYIINNKKHIVR